MKAVGDFVVRLLPRCCPVAAPRHTRPSPAGCAGLSAPRRPLNGELLEFAPPPDPNQLDGANSMCSPDVFTVAWAAVLGILYLLACQRATICTFETWFIGSRIAGALMLGIGVSTVFLAVVISRAGAVKWIDHEWLVALVLFWAVFPPLWFPIEEACYERGSITDVKYNDAGVLRTITFRKPIQVFVEGTTAHDPKNAALCDAFLKDLRLSQERAAKVWAALGALLGVVIATMK